MYIHIYILFPISCSLLVIPSWLCPMCPLPVCSSCGAPGEGAGGTAAAAASEAGAPAEGGQRKQQKTCMANGHKCATNVSRIITNLSQRF